MDAMLGLVVAAIGALTLVTAFQIQESQKRLFSYLVAALLAVAGLYYYASSEIRGFQMRRRLSEIQQRQQVNLEEIQRRLRDNQTQAPAQTPPKR